MFMVRYFHKRRRSMTKEEFEKKLQESFGVNSYEELDFETLTEIVVRAIGAYGDYHPMQKECVEMLEYILEADSKLPPSRFFDNRKCSQQGKNGNSVLIAALRKTHATPMMCVNLVEVVELFIKYNPDALYIENEASQSFVGEIFDELGSDWNWKHRDLRRVPLEDIEDEYYAYYDECLAAMTKILEHNPIRAWKSITSNKHLRDEFYGSCCYDGVASNLLAMDILTELLNEDGRFKSLDQSDKEALDSCIKNAHHKYDAINKETDKSK